MYFWTQFGSMYQLDPDSNRMRRLAGAHSPTANQAADGQWQEYMEISPPLPVVGEPVMVIWGTYTDVIMGEPVVVVRRTQTSVVEGFGEREYYFPGER